MLYILLQKTLVHIRVSFRVGVIMTDSLGTNESKPMSEDVWKISGDQVSEDIGPNNSTT